MSGGAYNYLSFRVSEMATYVAAPSEDFGPGTIPEDQVEDRKAMSECLNRMSEFLWALERYDSGDSDNWQEVLSKFEDLSRKDNP